MIEAVINLSREDGNYNLIQYPDGQQDIVITYIESSSVIIKSRMNSFRDIEKILCTTAALRRIGCKNIELAVPYVLGARGDRKFQWGGTSYLRDVVAPILNAQNYNRVNVYDIHNPVMADACIDRLVVQDNSKLVQEALTDIGREDVIICCPDEGASKKICPLLKKIEYTGDVITCSKKRDVNGSITETSVGNLTSCKNRPVAIIDDICDGGRTFIEIAKKVQERDCNEMYLIISHGIFSNGYEELSKWFKKIYCTNSVSDINNLLIKQTVVI